jgi:hypothetical protein
MATDKSEPRVGLILKVGVLSIALLIGVHAFLVSYFDEVARAEEHRKMGDVKPEALLSARADAKARLNSGAMPIDKAMQQLAQRGRMEASPMLTPSASKDVAPLAGWSKMPSVVPPSMTASEPAPNEPPSADGGVVRAAIGDAGAAKRAKPDGGPPKLAPKRP